MKLVPAFLAATMAGATALTMATQIDVSQAGSPSPDVMDDIFKTALAEIEPVVGLDNGNFISFHERQNSVVAEAFADYCERNPENCAINTEEYGMVQEAEQLAAIDTINRSVNASIVPAEDDVIHGVPEYWTEAAVMDDTNPTALAGDCEDYVLTKMVELQAAGIPADALSIVVVDPNIEGSDSLHAVLAVRTGEGDLILDNLTDETKYLHKTGYTPIQATTFSNHGQWQAIGLTEFGVSATMGKMYEEYDPAAQDLVDVPLPRPRPDSIPRI